MKGKIMVGLSRKDIEWVMCACLHASINSVNPGQKKACESLAVFFGKILQNEKEA